MASSACEIGFLSRQSLAQARVVGWAQRTGWAGGMLLGKTGTVEQEGARRQHALKENVAGIVSGPLLLC